ncbi:MAG: hypothetical protein ABIF71_06545 [Planctomycetota bacterium]
MEAALSLRAAELGTEAAWAALTGRAVGDSEETGLMAELEAFAAAHPGHPAAARARALADGIRGRVAERAAARRDEARAAARARVAEHRYGAAAAVLREWLDAASPSLIQDLPPSRYFSPGALGHVFLRSGFAKDDIFIAYKCGNYYDNHGHFDQGSFVINCRGNLALDSGEYYGFDSPHRLNYYRRLYGEHPDVNRVGAGLKPALPSNRETAIKGGFQTGTNHPNRPMVDSRAWLTPKSAKAFSAGIRKSAFGGGAGGAGVRMRRLQAG